VYPDNLDTNLNFGHLDEDLCRGIVDSDGLQDGGAVVGHLNLTLVPAHPPQDLVHTLGP